MRRLRTDSSDNEARRRLGAIEEDSCQQVRLPGPSKVHGAGMEPIRQLRIVQGVS